MFSFIVEQKHYESVSVYFLNCSSWSRSGPDKSCGQDNIGLFLKIDLATGNHVSQYHL